MTMGLIAKKMLFYCLCCAVVYALNETSVSMFFVFIAFNLIWFSQE